MGYIYDLYKFLNCAKGLVYPCRKPSFIDHSKKPYIPTFQRMGDKVVLQPQEIYTVSRGLSRTARTLKSKDKMNTLVNVWEYVIRKFSYAREETETWRYPQTTEKMKKGDCEDTTILFVTLSRLAGISPYRLFNACGLVHHDGEEYGHSYPIYYKNNGWLIFETTLNELPGKPQKLKDSKYTVDWGVANDSFAGMLKNQDNMRYDYFQKMKRSKDEEHRKNNILRVYYGRKSRH